MFRSVIVICGICGLVIVIVFELTKPAIIKNQQNALNKAVFTVIPQTKTKQAWSITETNTLEESRHSTNQSNLIYASYDENNRLLGFAISAQGMGYQDTIHVLYAYDAERQIISGFTVLQNRETPGLGSKIASNHRFLENFNQLDVQLNKIKNTLLHNIEVVSTGNKKAPYQIDAISGATVSSFAVAEIVQKSISHWAPVIQSNIKRF